MSARVVWRQRPPRHERRYSNPRRFPYLLHWGNSQLTIPAKMRTLVGARVLALLWAAAGRRFMYIECRKPDVSDATPPSTRSGE